MQRRFAAPALAAVLLLASGLAAAQAPRVPPADTMAQRMQACTVCHGKEGRATREGYFPRIAGKPAGYLYQQLLNFRDGRRSNAAMAQLLQHLSDDYLREIADYFAGLDLPYPAAAPTDAAPDVLARGAALARQGDAARGIPACASCHGERLTGVRPAVPGLVGLPRGYLAAQLGAWRSGQRGAAAPDCMAEIAARLGETDVSAVAAWLSSRSPPVDARPAAAHAAPPPLDCGSDPR